MYKLKDFSYNLPENLIAQYPLSDRAKSRLFVVNRERNTFDHKNFSDVVEYINSNDIVVFNNVKVINARLFFLRETGARVEVVLTKRISDNNWHVITNKTNRLNIGETIFSEIDSAVKITLLERNNEEFLVETSIAFDEEILKTIGTVPLPPYIQRKTDKDDDDRYQTVYADKPGAVAAPTAGLHFTPEILNEIKHKGAEIVFITLYVSWGTFSPVRNEDISTHPMHSEDYEISEDTAYKINSTRASGGRVIAVGTTSLRVLESTYKEGINIPGKGSTDIFIYPPQKVKSVDCLITNFHTPESTLLMLITAFGGYDLIIRAYAEAVEKQYRFFSYGDSMIII